MKREIIKIDTEYMDTITLSTIVDEMWNLRSNAARVTLAKNVQSLSPRMASMYAQELKARKSINGLL
jgi:hypothetical protein